MTRPVRTSNLLNETAADHENLDRMADQERLAVNRAATQPPVQENESVIEKAEEKEPSVQEKLDAILPDDFFGEFEDLFNSEDVHIKEQIKQDMSPDILLKAHATVTDDGAAQAVSEAAEEKEVRIGINKEDFRPYAEQILSELSVFVEESDNWSLVPKNYEGIRANCTGEGEDGWFLIRISLHEPLLALNIESNEIGGTDKIYATLKSFLENYDLKGL